MTERRDVVERARYEVPAIETPRWIRHRPTKQQNRAALAAGLGVGLVLGGAVFYLARLLLAREPLSPAPRRGEREAS